MKITVLAGGVSPEAEVSALSGKNVAAALCKKHRVALIDPARPVRHPIFSIEPQIAIENFDRTRNAGKPAYRIISPSALDACKYADRVFLALHGGSGENGELQRVLEKSGIPFCGSDPEACAAAMDKIKTKNIYRENGIPTPEFSALAERHLYRGGFPAFVKPVYGGSSIGVRRVLRMPEPEDESYPESDAYFIEEGVCGREFTVGILGDEPLAVTEIRPKAGFYDPENKYIPGRTEEITPAPLPVALCEEATCLALRAHRALGMRNFSRTDMMLPDDGSGFTLLETNALPGMTELSLFPQMARAVGMTLTELCERMLGII